MLTSSVPIVDFGGFRHGNDHQRQGIADVIDQACRDIGFFAITNHGVGDDVIDDVRREALAFFDLPLIDRLAVAMPAPGYPYGYSPIRGEALSRSIGGASPPDLKETYSIGPIGSPPRPLDEMDDPDERAVYAANRWPGSLPTFRPALERWYRALSDLSADIMQSFALALGLQATTFDPFIDRHGSALRLAHYPALDAALIAGQLRAGAHTDYGTLTVLWTDGAPGLQVHTTVGEWVDVEPIEGGLIVNVGDLMQRWSNDRWRSTMHRVVADGCRERRLSVPFFHNANWDARIECIVEKGDVAHHAPTTAGRHLMDKFRSTVT